jgi:hypothetical protein
MEGYFNGKTSPRQSGWSAWGKRYHKPSRELNQRAPVEADRDLRSFCQELERFPYSVSEGPLRERRDPSAPRTCFDRDRSCADPVVVPVVVAARSSASPLI